MRNVPQASTHTNYPRGDAFPNYKGARTSVTTRLELAIVARIKRAAVGKGQSVNDWISATLDYAATSELNGGSLKSLNIVGDVSRTRAERQTDLETAIAERTGKHVNKIASAPDPKPLGPSRRRVRAA